MILGFIGTGHMGSSIARALHQQGIHRFLLNNRTKTKAIAIKEEFGADAEVATLEEIAAQADIIFVGVKPTDMDDVLRALPAHHGIIVSMAAGVSLQELVEVLPNSRIIRILPNTPVVVGAGITLTTFDGSFTPKEKDAFFSLMSPTGRMIEVGEDKLNPGGVITGSAPAYLDYFIDALAEAGVNMGLSKVEATEYVLHMCRGAIELALSSTKSPRQLGDEVCSPGGSTIEGVKVLLERDLYGLVRDAAIATYQKNKKMR